LFVVIFKNEGLFLVTTPRPALRPVQFPVQWVPEPSEADQRPPTSALVKNECSYTSTTPYVFMALCLNKQRSRVHGLVLSQARWQIQSQL